ncbi:MAG TPA: peptidoglycan DD-metalloendopeptidase family protein [Bordetella sp.]|uniref:murein hydrolase activator EnvC family protein n=1 Tax=Bordetella sp. TaxID=28081 RepID=UPI002ED200E0
MRPMAGCTWAAALALAAACACAAPAAADLASQQTQAEQKQATLRARIDVLQKAIDAREAARKDAADALRASETAISRIDLQLRNLGVAQHRAQTDLANIEKQITAEQVVLAERREELARQLRAEYASGLSPWAALLSGGDPQQLGRNLGYLDFVSQARARALAALRAELDRMAQLQTAAANRRADLARVATETAAQKTKLLAEQKERAGVLARIEGQLQVQRVEAGKLGRDDQRMTHLIDDLQVAIARQAAEEARRAEEARKAEMARKAELARQAEQARQAEVARKAQQARQAQLAAEQARRAAAAANADNGAAQENASGLQPRLTESSTPRLTPPALQQQAPETAPPPRQPVAVAQQSSQEDTESPVHGPHVSGSGLKHGLMMPVAGGVPQGRFGLGRPDGGVWRGIVLRAPAGAPVRSVAAGVVVYADWLRGFGNLMIVDNGQHYMTVYGYNQSLLKHVGDPVAAGDVIATVGATGGQVESGLYFEIRYQGRPVDPAQWLAQ